MGNDISSIPLFESNIRKYGEWEDGKQCCDDKLKKKSKENNLEVLSINKWFSFGINTFHQN